MNQFLVKHFAKLMSAGVFLQQFSCHFSCHAINTIISINDSLVFAVMEYLS